MNKIKQIREQKGLSRYQVANVHNAVKNNHGCIKVKLGKNPDLIPCVSSNQEKYVRSEPNDTPNDNLLKLPRY